MMNAVFRGIFRPLSCVLFCGLFLAAKGQGHPEIPAAVSSAFHQVFAQAKHVHWNISGDDYVAFFAAPGQQKFAIFSATGNLVASATTVKNSWHLPSAIRSAFYNSRYGCWYIEKIRHLHILNQNSLHQLIINNGNLVDGDHYDNFFQKQVLYISDNGDFITPPLSPLLFYAR